MEIDLLHSHSVWCATADPPIYPSLAANVTVDVCVIGAGIAGLTSAYLLACQGRSVALIEALDIGAGETGRSSAHIAVHDVGYAHIEATHGRESARLLAESFSAAIDLIEAIVQVEQIECEFQRVDGYFYSCSSDPHAVLQKELESATRAGVEVSLEARTPIRTITDSACLRFARQGRFHPLKYLIGLANAITRRGGTIYCATRALDVEERSSGVTVKTIEGSISASAAVVATNTPFNDRIAVHVKQSAYQTYIVAALVDRGSLPDVLLWDDDEPYHYVRLARGPDAAHDLLIVGGADHKTGQAPNPQQHYRELEAWLRTHVPTAGALAYRWSGEVMQSLDGMAYLGRNPGSRNVYVVTGDSGTGITHATIGAIMICDLIMGREARWLDLYDPARRPLREALHFIKDQSNVASQYIGWLSQGDEQSAAALAPGEGAVIRSGMRKLAVYRDDEGTLHCHSAKCSHLGCIVQWNAPEHSWDCPCHGSRFSAYGSVLHGPAVRGLAAAELGDVKGEPRSPAGTQAAGRTEADAGGPRP